MEKKTETTTHEKLLRELLEIHREIITGHHESVNLDYYALKRDQVLARMRGE